MSRIEAKVFHVLGDIHVRFFISSCNSSLTLSELLDGIIAPPRRHRHRHQIHHLFLSPSFSQRLVPPP